MNLPRLTIPKPCHENWNMMTSEDKGRFCQMCQKTVVDFSVMDNREVATFFEQHKGEKVCGRVSKVQLHNRVVNLRIPKNILLSQTSFRKIFLLALFVTMGATLLSCKSHNDNKMMLGEVAYIDTLAIDNPQFDTVYYSDVNRFKNKDKLSTIIATDTIYINPGDDSNVKSVVMIRPGDTILPPPPSPVEGTYKAPKGIEKEVSIKKNKQ